MFVSEALAVAVALALALVLAAAGAGALWEPTASSWMYSRAAVVCPVPLCMSLSQLCSIITNVDVSRRWTQEMTPVWTESSENGSSSSVCDWNHAATRGLTRGGSLVRWLSLCQTGQLF